jgi:fibronectin-binding autotransporter adhesin
VTITAGTFVSTGGITAASKTQTITVSAGDCLFLLGSSSNTTDTITGVSDTNGAVWRPLTFNNGNGAGNGETVVMWFGRVKTTGSTTVTATFSSATAPWEFNLIGFTSSFGSTSVWTVNQSRYLTGSSATVDFPTAAPTASGGLYVGFCDALNTLSEGSTSGFTYKQSTGFGDVLAYDTNVTASVSPTCTQSASAAYISIGALLEVTNGKPAIAPVGSNAVIAGPFSSTETGSITYDVENVGDIIVLIVITATLTGTSPGVTGGGVTSWSRLVDNTGADGTDDLWWGVATSTGSVTASVTGAVSEPNAWGLGAIEFASSISGAVWSKDTTGATQGTGATVTYPALTPATSNEMYIGFFSASATLIDGGSGTTTGVSYLDLPGSNNTQLVYGLTSSTLTPVFAQSAAGEWDSMAALVAATASTITGTAAVSVPAVTVAATGKRTRVGSVTVTTPTVVLAATGKRTAIGQAALSLGAPVVAATGVGHRNLTGSAAVAIPSPTVTAVGIRTAIGSTAVSIPVVAIAATGVGHRNLTGSAALAVPAITIALTGQRTAVSHGGVAAPGTVIAVTGRRIAVGTAAVSIPGTVIAVAGQRTTHAVAVVAVPSAVISASGSNATTITGTAAVSVPAPTIAVTAKRTAVGHASIEVSAPTVLATGQRTAIGTATVAIGTVTVSATSTGHRTVAGTVAITAGPLELAAQGVRTTHGSAAVAITGPAVAVTGHRTAQGTANLAVATVTVAAAGRTASTVEGTATVTIAGVAIAARAPANPGLIRVRVTATYEDVGQHPITWATPSFYLSKRVTDGVSETVVPTSIGCTLNPSGQLVGPDGQVGVVLVALDVLGNGQPVLQDDDAVYVLTGQPGQIREHRLRVLASMAPQVDLATIQGAA